MKKHLYLILSAGGFGIALLSFLFFAGYLWTPSAPNRSDWLQLSFFNMIFSVGFSCIAAELDSKKK